MRGPSELRTLAIAVVVSVLGSSDGARADVPSTPHALPLPASNLELPRLSLRPELLEWQLQTSPYGEPYPSPVAAPPNPPEGYVQAGHALRRARRRIVLGTVGLTAGTGGVLLLGGIAFLSMSARDASTRAIRACGALTITFAVVDVGFSARAISRGVRTRRRMRALGYY